GPNVHDRLREQHHRVVVAAVTHEIAMCVAEPLILREPRRAREIGLVGYGEAEQVAVELARFGELVDVEAEMAEAADLERPLEQDAADIIAMTVAGHGRFPPSLGPGSLTG